MVRTFIRLAAAGALALSAVSPLAAKGRSGGILPGASAKDPVDIDAGKLDYFDKEQKLVYSGSVVVTNGPSTLKASRLVIFLDGSGQGKAGTGSDRVKHIDAEGPVTLVSKEQIGTGDRGSYDRGENKVYLIGNVTLSQGDNVAKGERLVYDIATGQATVLGGQSQGGRVRSVFTPGEAKGSSPAAAGTRQQN
jgi:lipopolysaccharide export system protein LptA